MSWVLLVTAVLALGIAFTTLATRQWNLRLSREVLEEIERAEEQGTAKARLQYPVPDLTRCIGCATCVAACPEEGVLEVAFGQARVVHGSRCVGHGRCAAECPVGAIALTLGDLSDRRDIPALTEELQAVGTPGLYLAGEVTGFALIRTAIEHGTRVAGEVAANLKGPHATGADAPPDLLIVGAGPAGLACALEAKRLGLRAVILEQGSLGGTVAQYPRRKLVMTQPVHLPLHGKLKRTSYSKEQLMDLWEEIAQKQELEIQTGCEFLGCTRAADGTFRVETSHGERKARAVCLAVGRRGSPRKLGVPGEERTNVAYSLLDAQSYTSRQVLVVGGGDSAVEAALGLAEQPGNQVTLSYRRPAFNRLKARNISRIDEAIRQQRVHCLYESQVRSIGPGRVDLVQVQQDRQAELQVENDDVFILAGGIPPFQLLEKCGVSLDPKDHPKREAIPESGDNLARVLGVALLFALTLVLWLAYFQDYYGLTAALRLDSPHHDLLRSGSGIGLLLGIVGTVCLLANLAYLARRSPRIPFFVGSLRGWMSSHVLTGLLAFLMILGHSAMLPRPTVGGHALACLGFLVLTGAIGRYFYSFVPRSQNGRELQLEDARSRFEELAANWSDQRRELPDSIAREFDALVCATLWDGGFFRRVVALLRGQRELRRVLQRIDFRARGEGFTDEQRAGLSRLARKTHREALITAHLEELRGLVASWRYFHRWVALLMVALVVLHILGAVRFAGILGGANG